MKRKLIVALVLVSLLSPALFAKGTSEVDLVVYGSTEEEHLRVTCEAFSKKTGYKVAYQRLSAGEVQTKIMEEVKAGGKPSADVFFGGTNDIYNELASLGIMYPFKDAAIQKRFVSDSFYHPDGYWYGFYKNVLGIFYNENELKLRGLAAPKGFVDLLDAQYAGTITACNPNTAGTGKQFINIIAQLCYQDSFQKAVGKKLGMNLSGQEETFKAYFAALNNNVVEYTKGGGTPANYLGSGEVIIGISYMQNVVEQVARYGISYAGIVQIEETTGYEICAIGIFNDAKNLAVAKEFIEYCTTTDCVSLFKSAGCYATPVIYDQNGVPYDVEESRALGIADIPLMAYDTLDALNNTGKYVKWFTEAVGTSERNTKLKTS